MKRNTVVVQLPIPMNNPLGTSDELRMRHEIEAAIGEQLEARGLGVCDGGDIGGGTMNVFLSPVTDVDAVVALSVELLRANGWLIEGAQIATRRDGDDKFTVAYPVGFVGDFNIWGTPEIETVM